jgi:hypothetical protein
MKARRKKEKRKETITWTVGTVLVLGFILFLIFRPQPETQANTEYQLQPRGEGVGTLIPPETADHIPDGDPVDSPSDPPTSGTHYVTPMGAGFYTVNSPEYLDIHHDGYLIHSMEHGYVIFWYNCNLLTEDSCNTLQDEIKSVMDEFNGFKVIAFPRPTLDKPLVMTSWGYMQEFDAFDRDLAVRFVETNQPLAPEPDAM